MKARYGFLLGASLALVSLQSHAVTDCTGTHGKQVTVYYAATYACATLPTYWSSPVPTYFGVLG